MSWRGLVLAGVLLSACACGEPKGSSNGGSGGVGGLAGAAGEAGSAGGDGGAVSGDGGAVGSSGGAVGSSGGAVGSSGGAVGSSGGAVGSDVTTGTITTTSGSGGAGGTTFVACTGDADCENVGSVCDLLVGHCVECRLATDCGDGERCKDGLCVDAAACESNADCEGVTDAEICDTLTGRCQECVSASDCPGVADCVNRLCRAVVSCVTESDCPAAQVCDTSTSRCIDAPCASDADCGLGSRCAFETCRLACWSDSDCASLGQWCDLGHGACTECVVHADCPESHHCSGGQCLPDECTPGSGYCEPLNSVANTIHICTASGSGYDSDTCESATCIEGEQARCEAWLCRPESRGCNANLTQGYTCSADGQSYASTMDCPEDQRCHWGDCYEMDCLPSTMFCRENQSRLCTADGLGSVRYENCDELEHCEAGACVSNFALCIPEAPICNGSIATTCNAAGDDFVSGGTDCADSDQLCVGGQCRPCNSSILLLGNSDETTEALRAALESAGMFVQTEVENPSEVGAVVNITGSFAEYEGSVVGQEEANSILAAHAAGVGYVSNSAALEHDGMLDSLLLLREVTWATAEFTLTLAASGHPVWSGLPTSFTLTQGVRFNYGPLINGGVAIATCAGCDVGGEYPGAAVAVREGTGGRVVHFANAWNYDSAYLESNLLQLFANASQWAARCEGAL